MKNEARWDGAVLGEETTLQCTDEAFPSFVLHWFPGYTHARMHACMHTPHSVFVDRTAGTVMKRYPAGLQLGAYILILVNLALIHMG